MAEELRKALLTTAVGSGSALVPEDLEPALIEYLYKVSPLTRLLKVKAANGATHEYNKRTGVPASWFEGELTSTTQATSSYERATVQLKILRTGGGVSGFAQAATREFINALESEITGSVEGFADLVEFGTLWGSASADTYQFSGLDTFVQADTTARADNVFDVNGVITLTDLDNMLNAAEGFREVQRDPKVFIASRGMISKISGLQTKILRNVNEIEYEGGFRMRTYMDIPLLPSDFVKPATTTTSPSDLAAAAATGGTLATGSYYYKIASVTLYGEQLAGSTEATVSTTGSQNTVNLTWTADTTAKLYKVYRGTSTGDTNLTYLTTIAAKAYDSTGLVTASVAAWSDSGSVTQTTNVQHPLSTGMENIFLINLNDARGMALLNLTGEMGNSVGSNGGVDEAAKRLIRYIELARTKSAFEYLLEGFLAAQVPWPKLHAISRRVKVA